jgi:hypothetical protein
MTDENQEFEFDVSEYEDLLAASRQIAREDGFTLIPDAMTRIYGLAIASVWSVIRRHTKMSKGYCCASHETLARFLGVSVSTLERHLKVLIKDKYIVDVTPNIKNRPHVYMTTRKFEFEIVVTISESGREERRIKKSPSQNDGATPSNCIGHPVKLTDEDTIKETIKDNNSAQKTGAHVSSLDELEESQKATKKPTKRPSKKRERAQASDCKPGLEILPQNMLPLAQAFIDGCNLAGLHGETMLPIPKDKTKWMGAINEWFQRGLTPDIIRKAVVCQVKEKHWDVYSPKSVTTCAVEVMARAKGEQENIFISGVTVMP